MPHVKYILENRNNELCVADVFEKLLKVAETSIEPPVYDSAKKKIIVKALNVHLAVERVVVNGFKLIASQLNTIGEISEISFTIRYCVLYDSLSYLIADNKVGSVALLVARRTNDREVAGSRPTKV